MKLFAVAAVILASAGLIQGQDNIFRYFSTKTGYIILFPDFLNFQSPVAGPGDSRNFGGSWAKFLEFQT